MGVAMILGDKSFEANADGSQKWIVSAQYDFKAEEYKSFVIMNTGSATGNLKSAQSGYMFVQNSTTALTEDTLKTATWAKDDKLDETHLFLFGSHEDAISRIKTSGVINYVVIVTEQDVKNASVNLGVTT